MRRFTRRYSAYTLAILLCGCGSGLRAAVQCRLDAVEQILPDDPKQITVVEAVKLGERIAVCKAQEQPDGGAQ